MENILSNIGIYITLVGISFIIIVSGICWAKKQITKSLAYDFVTQQDHSNKEKEINERFKKEINDKYIELKAQLEKNHRDWEQEIRRIKDETDKTKELLFRIDEKVGLLLANKIKKD